MIVQSTADRVLAALQSYGVKLEPNGKYRCEKSPLRSTSDSNGFTLIIDDPEHGAFYDHVTQERGSLYTLARHLKVAPGAQNGAFGQTEYDYVDERGKLLYQAVRYYKKGQKEFYQRQPDGLGGWNKSVTKPPIRHVLYQLPEVTSAVQAGETIYVVEGEKDANTLRFHGLTATTNVGGCGKWRDEYSETLRGASVIVLPDNDQPGADHAQQVKQSLQGVAASICIVQLPGLPPKGDVTD